MLKFGSGWSLSLIDAPPEEPRSAKPNFAFVRYFCELA
jgi:hypothetical protein